MQQRVRWLCGKGNGTCPGPEAWKTLVHQEVQGSQRRWHDQSKGNQSQGESWSPECSGDFQGGSSCRGGYMVTLVPALSHCLPASPLTGRWLLVPADVRPLWTPGRRCWWAQVMQSPKSTGSFSPNPVRVARWGVRPQSPSLAVHTPRISWSQPLSLFL